MKKLFLILSIFVSSLNAAEWSADIQAKPLRMNMHETKGAHTFIHEKLDISAYKFKLEGEDQLVVRLRNGKHKMGESSITIKSKDSIATMKVARIDIAKPMAIISKKGSGAHLFETFTEEGKVYEIYYHIKNGKLDSKITVSSK